jgi:hypothetical protein
MAALRLLVLSLGHAYHNSKVIGAMSPKPRTELTGAYFYTGHFQQPMEVKGSINKARLLKTERRYKQQAHTHRDIGWNYMNFVEFISEVKCSGTLWCDLCRG